MTPTSAADVAWPRMPPCARATVGRSWERSWPSSTKRCSVGLPSPDRELPSRGSLHSSRTLGSGLPISTLFSLVIYVAGIVRGKNVGTHTHQLKGSGPNSSSRAGGVGRSWDASCACSFGSLNACDVGRFGGQSKVSGRLPKLLGENRRCRG